MWLFLTDRQARSPRLGIQDHSVCSCLPQSATPPPRSVSMQFRVICRGSYCLSFPECHSPFALSWWLLCTLQGLLECLFWCEAVSDFTEENCCSLMHILLQFRSFVSIRGFLQETLNIHPEKGEIVSLNSKPPVPSTVSCRDSRSACWFDGQTMTN